MPPRMLAYPPGLGIGIDFCEAGMGHPTGLVVRLGEQ